MSWQPSYEADATMTEQQAQERDAEADNRERRHEARRAAAEDEQIAQTLAAKRYPGALCPRCLAPAKMESDTCHCGYEWIERGRIEDADPTTGKPDEHEGV